MALSQKSQLAIVLDLRRNRLEVREGARTVVVSLRSRSRRGLIAYLVAARLEDREASGFRSAADVLAEAPGWSRVKQLSSVGKRIWALVAESDAARRILAAPDGATTGPWTIVVAPEAITVVDRRILEELLAERRDRRPPPEKRAASIGRHAALVRDALLEIEEDIVRGHLVGATAARVRRVIGEAQGSHEGALRAFGARIAGMLLRREGKLRQAEGQLNLALRLYENDDGQDPAERAMGRASVLNELGAIAYRRGRYADAARYFRREKEAIELLGADHGAKLERSLRCLALTALRLDDRDEAVRHARASAEAARRAGDDAGRIVARAVELRVLAHSPGVDDLPQAHRGLAELVGLVPVTDPAAGLFVRRLFLETLYLMEDEQAADRLALALVRDAQALGSARDLDAVVRLLRRHERREVLRTLPRRLTMANRDEIQDWKLVRAATAIHVGRRSRLARITQITAADS